MGGTTGRGRHRSTGIRIEVVEMGRPTTAVSGRCMPLPIHPKSQLMAKELFVMSEFSSA